MMCFVDKSCVCGTVYNVVNLCLFICLVLLIVCIALPPNLFRDLIEGTNELLSLHISVLFVFLSVASERVGVS